MPGIRFTRIEGFEFLARMVGKQQKLQPPSLITNPRETVGLDGNRRNPIEIWAALN